MKRLLLTGASGFLGGILYKKLRDQGLYVESFNLHSQTTKIDIRFPFKLEKPKKFDIILHSAGKAHVVPKSKVEKEEFYRVNFDGTKNLCHALEDCGVLPKAFLFISTVAVYGREEGEMLTENTPLSGNTPYAESKVLAECWLNRWAELNGVMLGILRLPLVVGPNPPGNLGSMIRAIKSGRYLSIGTANARKSMVLAEDIANIVPVLAEKGGDYNITDGYHPTFGEMEIALAQALNKRIPVKIPYWFAKGVAKMGDLLGPQSPINSYKLHKITSTLTFDDGKARRELGWSPRPVLKKIKEII